jgi:hypothetical protein
MDKKDSGTATKDDIETGILVFSAASGLGFSGLGASGFILACLSSSFLTMSSTL